MGKKGFSWPVALSILIIGMSPFLVLGVSAECFICYGVWIEIPVSKQCTPNQMPPRSAASDLGLHCLYIPSERFTVWKG